MNVVTSLRDFLFSIYIFFCYRYYIPPGFQISHLRFFLPRGGRQYYIPPDLRLFYLSFFPTAQRPPMLHRSAIYSSIFFQQQLHKHQIQPLIELISHLLQIPLLHKPIFLMKFNAAAVGGVDSRDHAVEAGFSGALDQTA
jgi:hypothetical protein